MRCSACGTDNVSGRKFCKECGGRLALACPGCGAVLESGDKFCGECGAPVGAQPVGVQPVAGPASPASPVLPGSGPVAERRLVSVIFADLVGFTPFSEGRDSEEVRETLTRYFDIATEIVTRHGGTVEKFIGDAVMAVWGTPVAREDDAERAVRAALELLDAIKGLGPAISARAGVLTGEAAVTLGATNQGMVAGDLVNTAARLQAAAAPGTVLVGEATYRAASAAIAFEEAGEQALKGKELPVATWRALRVVAERGGRGRQEVLEAPFTGRDEELRMLKELFHVTSREQRARLVSITGPAGMGKSRLAWEFEKYLDGVVDMVWWNHGRSPAYGGGVTFWALGEMVRARCGLAETADEAETRTKVRAMLERIVPDPDERAWVEPAILALLGVGATVVAADELFARWRILFERLSTSGTVVLVFEDLQWADAGTLDFIDHLLDWSKAIPLLVVTLARPELLDTRPSWGAGRRAFVALPLDPLPEPAMRELLRGLVPDLPADAERRIIERAEGIPLYAVETVRMLAADKRLVQQGSVYVPVGDISTLAVPETLTALIAARLDTLEPADRALVLDAAVLGQRFTMDGLAAVSGMDAEALEPRLRGLVRREIFSLEADPRSPERGQYGFVQALIREVAYNTLARRDRKERHLAAARFFEVLGSDELAGALAGHYLSAHANASDGPEADALAAQARIALRGAADRATALGSYEQAATLLREALTVTASPSDRADTLERLGGTLDQAARYTDAVATFTEALGIVDVPGNDAVAARITRALGQCLVNAKQMEEAQAVLEQGVARFAGLDDEPVVLSLQAQLARVYLLTDHDRQAVQVCDQILERAEYGGHLEILADVLVTKGTGLGSTGRFREGRALVELGAELAGELGAIHTRFRALNNQLVLIGDVDPRKAYEASYEGMMLARKVGSIAWARNFAGNFGYIAYRTGEWDVAERELWAALDDDLEPGDAALILNNLLSIVAMRGEPSDELLRQLEDAAAHLPAQQARPLVPDSKAFVAMADGRYADAASLWREAAGEGIANGAGNLLSAAVMCLWAIDPDGARANIAAFDALHLNVPGQTVFRDGLLAALAIGDGQLQDGVARVEAARLRLVELGLPEDAARLAISAVLCGAGGHPVAEASLVEARAFLVRVRAEPLVAFCDRLAESEARVS